jgi:hypothetical protein
MTVLYTLPWHDGREVQVTQTAQLRLPDLSPRLLRAYDALAGDGPSDETRLVTGAKLRDIVAQMVRLSLPDELRRRQINVTTGAKQVYWYTSQYSGSKVHLTLPRGWRQRVFETGYAFIDGQFTLDLSPIIYNDDRELKYAVRVWNMRYRYGYHTGTQRWAGEREGWHSETAWRDVGASATPRYAHMRHGMGRECSHHPSADAWLAQ